MKNRRLLAVLFTIIMSLTVSVFAVACTKKTPNAIYYTVIFDYNYDNEDLVQVSVEAGKTVEPASRTRAGYTLIGWFDEEELPFDFATPITRDITLKAEWEENVAAPTTYAVTFTKVDGVKFNFDETPGATVKPNTTIAFDVEISPFHEKTADFAVTVNGDPITPDKYGVYTFKVTSATTVTVKGVEARSKEMEGKGTESDPKQIGTAAQWLGFAELLSDENYEGDEWFILTDDIDFRGYPVPVAEYAERISLNGKGHTLSNFKINDYYASYDKDGVEEARAGLIATAALSDFKNLTIENVELSVAASEDVAAGALVAYAMHCMFENIHVTGDSEIAVSGGGIVMAGGIVGQLYAITGVQLASNFASITFCTSAANVTAAGDLSYAGGIAGAVAGSRMDIFFGEEEYCLAFIAYCGATGTLTSDYTAGGIAAWVQPYAAIQNCYFAGAQNDVEFYGGIAGILYGEEEIVIANCFSTVWFTPSSTTGPIYGYKISYVGVARDYEADNFFADCYFAPNGEFADEELNFYDWQNEADRASILTLLKWNKNSWKTDEEWPVPHKAESFKATLGIKPEKAFDITADGEIRTVPAEKQTHSVPFLDPITFLGTFITSSYDGLLIAANETSGTWYSAGYYLDGRRLPAAYVITDNADTEEIELKFFNYGTVAEEYYFTSGSQGYRLVLNNDATATVVSNSSQTAKFRYVYFGEDSFLLTGSEETIDLHVIAFVGAPDYVFNTKIGERNFIMPRAYLNKETGCLYSMFTGVFEAYSYSDVVGSWTYGSTEVYQFKVNRTGTYISGDEEKDFTWAYVLEDGVKTGITVTFKGNVTVTLTFGEQANQLVDGAKSATYLKKANRYGGTYVSDVYTNKKLIVTGDEPFVNGEFTVGQHTYHVNANGFIVDEKGTEYYAENSFAGIWYGTTTVGKCGTCFLTLGGINLYGVGDAEYLGLPITYSVASVDGNKVTLAFAYYGQAYGTIDVTVNNDHLAASTMVVTSPKLASKVGDSVSLKVRDVFYGAWYAADGTTKYYFEDGTVTINEEDPVPYTYINKTTITVNGTTVTYDGSGDYSVVSYGTKKLTRGDIFGLYHFIDAHGVEWQFDGLGIIGEGTVKVESFETTSEFTYVLEQDSGDAILSVKDEPVYRASHNNGIVTLAPIDPETLEPIEDAEPILLGRLTLASLTYSGNWAAFYLANPDDEYATMTDFTIGVADKDGNFAVTAGGEYADITRGTYKSGRMRFYNEDGLFLYEVGNAGNMLILMKAGTSSGYPFYKLDVFCGTWTNPDGMGEITFDGWGDVDAYGYLEYTVTAGDNTYSDDTLIYMYDDDYDSMVMLYVEKGKLYYYYRIKFMNVDGVDEDGVSYGTYSLYYTTFEGTGINAGYAIVLIPFNYVDDQLTGELATDGKQQFLFYGNSIFFDVMTGEREVFLVEYTPDLTEPDKTEVLIYMVMEVDAGENEGDLVFKVAMFGESVYIAQITYNAEDGTLTIDSMEEIDLEAAAA